MWTYSLGEGYAGPAVVGDRVVIFHRKGDNELAEAINAQTGESQWQTSFEAVYRGGVNQSR